MTSQNQQTSLRQMLAAGTSELEGVVPGGSACEQAWFPVGYD